MYTLIGTAKLSDADPQAWLADVLARIADTPQSRLADLLRGTGRRNLQLIVRSLFYLLHLRW